MITEILRGKRTTSVTTHAILTDITFSWLLHKKTLRFELMDALSFPSIVMECSRDGAMILLFRFENIDEPAPGVPWSAGKWGFMEADDVRRGAAVATGNWILDDDKSEWYVPPLPVKEFRIESFDSFETTELIEPLERRNVLNPWVLLPSDSDAEELIEDGNEAVRCFVGNLVPDGETTNDCGCWGGDDGGVGMDEIDEGVDFKWLLLESTIFNRSSRSSRDNSLEFGIDDFDGDGWSFKGGLTGDPTFLIFKFSP